MLRVCFVTEDFYPDFIGGQGIYGKELVSELAKRGVHVAVLAEKKLGRRQFWQNRKNVRVFLVPFCFGQQLILAFLEYVFFILRGRREHFDILHANQLSGLFFVLFRPRNVKKIVVSVHNTNYDMYQITKSYFKRLLYLPLIFLERIMYRRADGLLFNSRSEKNALLQYYSIKTTKAGIVFLGKPEVNFSQQERLDSKQLIRKKLKIPSEEKIVLYLGRVVAKKRVANLVRALTILREEGLKVTGIIIGRGNMVVPLKKIAPHYIHILGFIPDTKPYFLASDLFVTTGVAEGGVALTVLEAAHFGLPLILSPDDADVPILKEEVNGYLANPDDPVDLAQKIKKALPNIESMGKESKKLSRQFSWERCRRETLNFYRSLLRKD